MGWLTWPEQTSQNRPRAKRVVLAKAMKAWSDRVRRSAQVRVLDPVITQGVRAFYVSANDALHQRWDIGRGRPLSQPGQNLQNARGCSGRAYLYLSLALVPTIYPHQGVWALISPHRESQNDAEFCVRVGAVEGLETTCPSLRTTAQISSAPRPSGATHPDQTTRRCFERSCKIAVPTVAILWPHAQ